MSFGEEFMDLALDKALESMNAGGGPFGAVIVRNGELIAAESNHVTQTNDPTAHAEVSAIRAACARLGTFDLSDCEIYSSCEPCPMCLGAIYWARLGKLWFGSSRQDAADAGFDDSFIYNQLELSYSQRSIPTEQQNSQKAASVFQQWIEKSDKIPY